MIDEQFDRCFVIKDHLRLARILALRGLAERKQTLGFEQRIGVAFKPAGIPREVDEEPIENVARIRSRRPFPFGRSPRPSSEAMPARLAKRFRSGRSRAECTVILSCSVSCNRFHRQEQSLRVLSELQKGMFVVELPGRFILHINDDRRKSSFSGLPLQRIRPNVSIRVRTMRANDWHLSAK